MTCRLGSWAVAAAICLACPAAFSHEVTGTTRTIPGTTVTWDELVAADAFIAQTPHAEHWVETPGERVAPRTFLLPAGSGSSLSTAAIEPQALGLRGICPPLLVEPVLSTNFQALPDSTTIIPPDTMGAVGPNHVMTMLNSQVRIQSRSGTILSTVTLATFWSPAGGSGHFDPRLVYDSLSGRFIATVDTNSRSASSSIALAVSATSDPLGAWRFFRIDADATDVDWADFPGLGVNRNWIAVANNMFTVSGSSFSGVKMWVFDKTSALAASGSVIVTEFPVGFDTSGGFDGDSFQPCVTLDAAQNTLYIADNSGWSDPLDDVQLIRISQITGSGPAPVWSVVPNAAQPSSGLFRVNTDFIYGQIDAPQLGDARLIETNSPRILNAVFRNGRIWATHSGGAPVGGTIDRTNVYWYQINPAAMPTPIVQSGVIDGGPNVHHSFPSIGVNCNEDAVIGFSRSDATRYIEAAYAVRLASDAPGATRPLRVLKPGESTYYKVFSGTRNRWGDYSATMVDPLDDTSFWTIQEYAETRVGAADNDSRWGTWWGRIVPGCAGDLNGDRLVNEADLGILLGSWQSGPGGDLNGDGQTSEPDLGILLGNWQAVCP